MAHVEDHRQEDDGADCREAVHTLYHYLDGELTEDRRVMIRAHLDRCHDCIEAYEFELELRTAITRSCRESVPEELMAKVARAIAHEHQTNL